MRKITYNYCRTILGVAVVVNVFCWVSTLASALKITPCEPNKCTPNCICDLRDNLECAKLYGNYGWEVPDDANDYVFHQIHSSSPIEYYQIKPAGKRGSQDDEIRLAGEGVGFGTIQSVENESLVGQVYFEIHPDQLKGSDKIFVELYGNVGFGLSDCAEHGTLLSQAAIREFDSIADEIDAWGEPDTVFSFQTFRFDSYNSVFRDLQVECHPRASGAVMATAKYTIYNPFDQSSIWFPDTPTDTRGRLDYCIRVRVMKPRITLSDAKAAAASSRIDGSDPGAGQLQDLVPSYDTTLDTKIRIEGNKFSWGFESTSSNQNVQTNQIPSMHSSQTIESFQEETPKIPAVAFLCSDGGKGKYNDFGTVVPSSMLYGDARRTYAVGQVFRVCVSPLSDEYSVVAFESVVCENFGEARSLFQEFVPRDDSMELDDTAFVSSSRNDVSYVNLETGRIVTAANTLSFRSMVTPEFRRLKETSFVCSGIVNLRSSSSSSSSSSSLWDGTSGISESTWMVGSKQTTVRSEFSLRIDLLAPGSITAQPVEENVSEKELQLGLILFLVIFAIFMVLLWFVWKRRQGESDWNGGGLCCHFGRIKVVDDEDEEEEYRRKQRQLHLQHHHRLRHHHHGCDYDIDNGKKKLRNRMEGDFP